jgi:hypothetical protein
VLGCRVELFAGGDGGGVVVHFCAFMLGDIADAFICSAGIVVTFVVGLGLQEGVGRRYHRPVAVSVVGETHTHTSMFFPPNYWI